MNKKPGRPPNFESRMNWQLHIVLPNCWKSKVEAYTKLQGITIGEVVRRALLLYLENGGKYVN